MSVIRLHPLHDYPPTFAVRLRIMIYKLTLYYMEYVTLNNGVRMPLLGYGVYQMEDAGLCRRCVGEAITTGYRLIDTAAVYLNEEAVGKAVEVSGVPRSEFFITSKVWIQDMGYEQTLRAFDRSLARLGMDYLDLYLPYAFRGCVRGMEGYGEALS